MSLFNPGKPERVQGASVPIEVKSENSFQYRSGSSRPSQQSFASFGRGASDRAFDNWRSSRDVRSVDDSSLSDSSDRDSTGSGEESDDSVIRQAKTDSLRTEREDRHFRMLLQQQARYIDSDHYGHGASAGAGASVTGGDYDDWYSQHLARRAEENRVQEAFILEQERQIAEFERKSRAQELNFVRESLGLQKPATKPVQERFDSSSASFTQTPQSVPGVAPSRRGSADHLDLGWIREERGGATSPIPEPVQYHQLEPEQDRIFGLEDALRKLQVSLQEVPKEQKGQGYFRSNDGGSHDSQIHSVQAKSRIEMGEPNGRKQVEQSIVSNDADDLSEQSFDDIAASNSPRLREGSFDGVLPVPSVLASLNIIWGSLGKLAQSIRSYPQTLNASNYQDVFAMASNLNGEYKKLVDIWPSVVAFQLEVFALAVQQLVDGILAWIHLSGIPRQSFAKTMPVIASWSELFQHVTRSKHLREVVDLDSQAEMIGDARGIWSENDDDGYYLKVHDIRRIVERFLARVNTLYETDAELCNSVGVDVSPVLHGLSVFFCEEVAELSTSYDGKFKCEGTQRVDHPQFEISQTVQTEVVIDDCVDALQRGILAARHKLAVSRLKRLVAEFDDMFEESLRRYVLVDDNMHSEMLRVCNGVSNLINGTTGATSRQLRAAVTELLVVWSACETLWRSNIMAYREVMDFVCLQFLTTLDNLATYFSETNSVRSAKDHLNEKLLEVRDDGLFDARDLNEIIENLTEKGLYEMSEKGRGQTDGALGGDVWVVKHNNRNNAALRMYLQVLTEVYQRHNTEVEMFVDDDWSKALSVCDYLIKVVSNGYTAEIFREAHRFDWTSAQVFSARNDHDVNVLLSDMARKGVVRDGLSKEKLRERELVSQELACEFLARRAVLLNNLRGSYMDLSFSFESARNSLKTPVGYSDIVYETLRSLTSDKRKVENLLKEQSSSDESDSDSTPRGTPTQTNVLDDSVTFYVSPDSQGGEDVPNDSEFRGQLDYRERNDAVTNPLDDLNAPDDWSDLNGGDSFGGESEDGDDGKAEASEGERGFDWAGVYKLFEEDFRREECNIDKLVSHLEEQQTSGQALCILIGDLVNVVEIDEHLLQVISSIFTAIMNSESEPIVPYVLEGLVIVYRTLWQNKSISTILDAFGRKGNPCINLFLPESSVDESTLDLLTLPFTPNIDFGVFSEAVPNCIDVILRNRLFERTPCPSGLLSGFILVELSIREATGMSLGEMFSRSYEHLYLLEGSLPVQLRSTKPYDDGGKSMYFWSDDVLFGSLRKDGLMWPAIHHSFLSKVQEVLLNPSIHADGPKHRERLLAITGPDGLSPGVMSTVLSLSTALFHSLEKDEEPVLQAQCLRAIGSRAQELH